MLTYVIFKFYPENEIAAICRQCGANAAVTKEESIITTVRASSLSGVGKDRGASSLPVRYQRSAQIVLTWVICI